MKNDNGHEDPGEQYAAAHAIHYTTKDLRGALQLYKGIIAAHPDTQEAGYSRSQLQNIVNAVVPKQDLLDAQTDLALVHLGGHDQQEVEPGPVTLKASESSD